MDQDPIIKIRMRHKDSLFLSPEEFAAPDPTGDRQAAIILAAHGYLELRIARRSHGLCEEGKRTSMASRPKGTGKGYWAWVGRREAILASDPELARLRRRVRAWDGPLSASTNRFLFSTYRHLAAGRWATIRADAAKIVARLGEVREPMARA